MVTDDNRTPFMVTDDNRAPLWLPDDNRTPTWLRMTTVMVADDNRMLDNRMTTGLHHGYG